MGRVLRNPAVLAVSLGHMTVDIFSTALPVLLVVFVARLGLSNVGLGTVATMYGLAASLTQPFFGWMADRWNTRWLGIGGLLWQAGGFVLAALLPGYAALGAFVLAGLGSGAYHPQGVMNARRAAGQDAASGTSIFFFFGMFGHALGPILAGFLLSRLQMTTTTLILAGIAGVVAVVFMRFAPHSGRSAPGEPRTNREQSQHIAWGPLTLMAFGLVIFFVSFPFAATGTFLPKWLSEAGFSSQAFGSLLSIFMVASAFGNVFGGGLADRWSRKGVVVIALALAPFPFYVLFAAPSTALGAYIAAALAGFTVGMPNSVMILMGQSLFPRRMGFGSGLVLGFLFSFNAIAGWLTGWLADLIGLHQALLLIPWAGVIAACCALLLPRTRTKRVVASVLAAGD